MNDLRPRRWKLGAPLVACFASLALPTRFGRRLRATGTRLNPKLLRAVRRIRDPLRSPRSTAEHSALGLLQGKDAMPFDTLVERVARELYADELRHGGSVLDVGLLGPTLFVPDVAREIQAADGILWQIEPSTDRQDVPTPIAAD
jgi:hypothetical protein